MKVFITLFFCFLFFTTFAQIENYNWPEDDPSIISEQYQVRVRVLDKDGMHGDWQDISVMNVVPRSPYNHPICGEQASAWNITGDRRTSFAPFAFFGPVEPDNLKQI